MTTVEKSLGTKATIVAAAAELFSAYGFAGASIRQIATQSGVNVAAINYHFGNKHNLYWAVMAEMSQWLDDGVKLLSDECETVQELAVRAYDFTMESPAAIRTAIKLMMSEGVPPPDGEFADIACKDQGPPGSAHFARILTKQLTCPIAPRVIEWAVHGIFASLLHWSMICSSSKITQIQERITHFTPDEIKKHLHFQVDALVVYLESNHQKIESQLK